MKTSQEIENKKQETGLSPVRWRVWFVAAVILILAGVISLLFRSGSLNPINYRPLPMEWVDIQAGEFLMGTDSEKDRFASPFEFPQHAVYLDAYRIMRSEVTNQQYNQCVRAGACPVPGNDEFTSSERTLYPVTDVSWYNATDFCQWTGGRLPTEAEWEKAARGEDGRIYPWGDTLPDCALANFNFCVSDVDTAPVGSYPSGTSPYGLYDMAGNVYEWVNDWFDSSYFNISPDSNPPGPDTGIYRGVRGGSWSSLSHLRTASRHGSYPVTRNHDIGFRCTADSP